MSIEFPLTPFRTKYGVLDRPVVAGFLKSGKRWKRYRFILDSGAEFTMLPRRVARSMGVDLDEFSRLTVEGIEGGGLRGILAPVPIRIADEQMTVRCFFAERDDSPFLLGRADVFDQFNILFDARRKRVVFTRI